MQGLYEAEFFLLHRIQELRAPFLDWFMERVSFLGNGGWLFIVTGLLLICPKRTRRVGISILGSLLCGFLIGNVFLKNAVMRSRPCWLDGTVALLVASPADPVSQDMRKLYAGSRGMHRLFQNVPVRPFSDGCAVRDASGHSDRGRRTYCG